MTNLDQEREIESIVSEIESLEKKGFSYLTGGSAGGFSHDIYIPNRFILLSNRIIDENELKTFFKKNKPEFGNKKHIEIRDALYYQKLISALEITQETGFAKFINVKDRNACIRKYRKQKHKW